MAKTIQMPRQRTIYFIMALAVYGIAAGADIWTGSIFRLAIGYVIAAIFVFWLGREPVGVLRPVSMRPICVLLGSIVMVCAFVMMLLVKDALHHLHRGP
jgi:hypothetical protein